MNPELVMVEADHDLRNPADFLIIDKIAKAMVRVHGIAQVQTITRPDGKPIEHASLAYSMSQSGTSTLMNNDYQQTVLDNTLKQANEMQTSIDSQEQLYHITLQLAEVTRRMADKMGTTSTDINDVRDHLADFDDFFRPIRNYLYWEPHCYDIPMCWSVRSIFDALDGINKMSDDFQDIVPDLNRMAELTPQMAAVMPAMIQTMKNQKQYLLNQYQAQKAQQDQNIANQNNQTAMGQAFDASRNDDNFYLPPEAFGTADFQRGIKLFMSPDGHAVRFTVFHQGDPLSEEGTSHIEPLKIAAADAIKGTPAGGLDGLRRWHRCHVQGHADRRGLRPAHRGGRLPDPDLPDHGGADPRGRGRGRHRRHRGPESRSIVRTLGAHLAAPGRYPVALDGASDVGHRAARRRGGRLQPAVGIPDEGGDPRGGAAHRIIRSMAGTGSVVTAAGGWCSPSR